MLGGLVAACKAKSWWPVLQHVFCLRLLPFPSRRMCIILWFRSTTFLGNPGLTEGGNVDLFLSYLSCSLVDCWGTTVVDFTISFLHSLWSLAFCSSILHSRPAHSLMLSSHRFLCLPPRLPSWTVPCRIVLASPNDRVTFPYHFSLHLFTEVWTSSYGLMAFPILALTSSLVMWSLYKILQNLRKHLISNACILLSMSAVMVHVSHAHKTMDRVSHAHKTVDMVRECISLILELMAMFLSFQMTFS